METIPVKPDPKQAWAMVGIVLIALSVTAYYHLASDKVFISTRALSLPTELSVGNPSLGTEPRGFVGVQVPAVIHVGESLPLFVKFHPEQQQIQPQDEVLAFLSQPLEFYLSGAGVDVEPKEWLTLGPDGTSTAIWSVKGIEPGEFTLVLNARMRPRDLTKLSVESVKKLAMRRYSPYVETVMPEFPSIRFADRNVTVTVKRKWIDYGAIGLTGIGTFMGSLLTLPGIIAFLKERKKDRERGLNLNLS